MRSLLLNALLLLAVIVLTAACAWMISIVTPVVMLIIEKYTS